MQLCQACILCVRWCSPSSSKYHLRTSYIQTGRYSPRQSNPETSLQAAAASTTAACACASGLDVSWRARKHDGLHYASPSLTADEEEKQQEEEEWKETEIVPVP
jgi:hypothetical protein